MNQIIYGDNLDVLQEMPDESVQLIYIDPPFNTGKTQARTKMRTVQADDGDRIGFAGKRYQTTKMQTQSFGDSFEDFMSFLSPRLEQAHRILAADGSLYFHIDYREVHYCKVMLDHMFGRDSFLNEIIWAYDFGARPTRRWPAKHDNILLYVKDPERYTFNTADLDREPYLAPALAGPEKAELGKLPTDVWWHTIVSPTGKEKTGYPTQKPLGVLRRIILASSNPGDTVLDFFAGSGTTGIAAAEADRKFILVDNNEQALITMASRFSHLPDVAFVDFDPEPHRTTAQQQLL